MKLTTSNSSVARLIQWFGFVKISFASEIVEIHKFSIQIAVKKLDEIWNCEFLNGSLICFLLCIYNLAVDHSLVDKLQLWLEGVAGLSHNALNFPPLRWKKTEGKIWFRRQIYPKTN